MFASQQSGRIWGIDQRNGRARRNPEFWLERSFTERANNEDWLENNFDKTVHPMENERGDHPTLAEEEERILRCLGAAVIMQWNTLPTKLQKELFDNASSMGDLLQTDALKGQIARFLHKHKDDGAGPSSDASRKGGR